MWERSKFVEDSYPLTVSIIYEPICLTCRKPRRQI